LQSSNAQMQSTLVDSSTNGAIPFASIWIENTNIGTTSDKNGKFDLDVKNSSNTVAFSAIGYELQRRKFGLLNDSIFLQPISDHKQEYISNSRERKRTTNIGYYDKNIIKSFFGAGKLPGATARFFEYKNSYYKTPFLNEITVLTSSDISKAKFLIKLYKKDSIGKPGEYIYHKNIIGTARRGKRLTKVDLSDLNIKFPKNGLFVAMEWLIIEDNKFKYSYISPGKNGELTDISYEPAFGMILSSTLNDSWSFFQGHWRRIPKDPMNDKFKLLALKLELSD